jgi:ATP adenylyltransferase
MEYILSDKEDGCFLCDLIDSDPSEDNLLLFKSERAMVLMNRYPYNNGHLMVAPKNHTADLSKLGKEEYTETMELFRFSLGVLERKFKPEGFNAGLNLGKSAGSIGISSQDGMETRTSCR